jgi:hypothetical protein
VEQERRPTVAKVEERGSRPFTDEAMEALRRAIDPYGIDGEQVTATRPVPSVVASRLDRLGYSVIAKSELTELRTRRR